MFKKKTEEFLKNYDTVYTATDFLLIRTYSTIVGFSTGVILAATSMIAGQPLAVGVILGTGLTIFGNQIPLMAVKRKDKKKRRKKLMAQYEELIQEIEMNKEKKDLKELLEEDKNKKELKKFMDEQNIKNIEEIEKKIKKMN